MAWVRIDDCFDDHPKMIRAEPAIGAWVRGLAYCNRFLTDGFIPERKALELAGKKKLAMLVDAVLWEPVPGGYRVHDYDDYQPTRAEVEAERAAAAARKANWLAKQNGVRNGVPEHVPDAFGTVAPKPKPKNYKNHPTAAAAASEEFENFWTNYPKRAGDNPKARALTAWNARMKEHVDPAEIMAGLGRYVAYLRATDKLGTEYVKQAASFLSARDRPWQAEWKIPGPAPGSEASRVRNELPGRGRQNAGDAGAIDIGSVSINGTHRWDGKRWVPL